MRSSTHDHGPAHLFACLAPLPLRLLTAAAGSWHGARGCWLSERRLWRGAEDKGRTMALGTGGGARGGGGGGDGNCAWRGWQLSHWMAGSGVSATSKRRASENGTMAPGVVGGTMALLLTRTTTPEPGLAEIAETGGGDWWRAGGAASDARAHDGATSQDAAVAERGSARALELAGPDEGRLGREDWCSRGGETPSAGEAATTRGCAVKRSHHGSEALEDGPLDDTSESPEGGSESEGEREAGRPERGGGKRAGGLLEDGGEAAEAAERPRVPTES